MSQSQDRTGMDGYDQRLVDYVYGELSDAGMREVEARLERDPQARAEVESLRAVRTAFSALPDAEPSPKVTYDILREARVAAADRAAKSRSLLGGLAFPKLLMHPAFASVCVLVLVSGAILALQKTGADRPMSPVAADEELGVFAAKSGTAAPTRAAEVSAERNKAAAPAGAVAAVAEPDKEAEPALKAELERQPIAQADPAPAEAQAAGPGQAQSKRRVKRALRADLLEEAKGFGGAGGGGGGDVASGAGKKQALARGRARTRAVPMRKPEPTPAKTPKMAKADRAADIAQVAEAAKAGGLFKGYGGKASGGDAPAKDKAEDSGLEGGWAASQAPAPAPSADSNAPSALGDSAGEALNLDELIAADLPGSSSLGGLGSAGNVATPRAEQAPAPQAAPASPGYDYRAGADTGAPQVAGGVRGGIRHQDLGSRELKLRIGDLDRLPASRAWGDSLGAVARSNQRASGVDRVRRKLLAMDFAKRTVYARFIREQIKKLAAQGHAAAAAELRALLEHIEFEESKEAASEEDSDDAAANAADEAYIDAEEAAALEAERDAKTAPKVEEYQQERRSKAKRKTKKAKVRMLKKSRSAPTPAPADALEADHADEADAPASTAF